MKILITGATGFVGQNLLPKLISKGYSIFEITIEPEKSKQLYASNTYQFFYTGENHQSLVKEINTFKPNVCIHLASYLTSADDYNAMRKLLQANIEFTCSILDALKQSGLSCFINTGSFAEYFQGDGKFDAAYLYTATKTASRSLVSYYSNVYNFKSITVAPYTIYGGIDSQKKIIDLIYDSLNSTIALDLTKGEQILDFIHVDDIADFFILLVENFNLVPSGSGFQLGTGIGHTLKELGEIIEKESGKRANINWGGKEYRPRDVMFAVANTSLQYHLLKWRPKINLAAGVKMYLKKKNINETN